MVVQRSSNIFISCDLGSNSFRVLIYDFTKDEAIGDFETTVGTADGLKQTGNISTEALNRIVKAINQSIEKLQYNPKDAIAVTTSAMRQAKNSSYILQQIQKETGISFTIISGDEEARLTLLGLQYSLKKETFNSENIILVDIGGGSTEIVFVKDNIPIYQSFEVGIVTLTQSLNKKDILTQFAKDIQNHINSLSFDIDSLQLIATAGTPTTIAALKHNLNYKTYDKTIINGTKVYVKDLDYYKNYLQSISLDEAEILTGTNRLQYIGSGIDIFKLIYTVLKKEFSIVFDEGLREGIVVDKFLSLQR
ncbi:MAG: exopolyphosphatase [Arcobacteraceae bacterium]|nr:exopolyphosphatase [Arcobacteraceae bacterium]